MWEEKRFFKINRCLKSFSAFPGVLFTFEELWLAYVIRNVFFCYSNPERNISPFSLSTGNRACQAKNSTPELWHHLIVDHLEQWFSGCAVLCCYLENLWNEDTYLLSLKWRPESLNFLTSSLECHCHWYVRVAKQKESSNPQVTSLNLVMKPEWTLIVQIKAFME